MINELNLIWFKFRKKQNKSYRIQAWNPSIGININCYLKLETIIINTLDWFFIKSEWISFNLLLILKVRSKTALEKNQKLINHHKI